MHSKQRKPPRNLVGPALRRLRNEKKLSQAKLAEALQRKGWSVTRDTIAKIEGQTRWVPDCEVMFLARFFGIAPEELFPKRELDARLVEFLSYFEKGL